ncbi:hypothetical protein EON66_09530 [archaeon]|nr:MAG: hypothetical protein EON66_09530 [archaeon]
MLQLVGHDAFFFTPHGYERAHAPTRPLHGCDPPSAAGEEQAAFADVLGPGWVASNQYICVHVAGVTLEQIQDACLPGLPLTLFSLLRHENRASVVHYKLMRTDTYTEPIASKVRAPPAHRNPLHCVTLAYARARG